MANRRRQQKKKASVPRGILAVAAAGLVLVLLIGMLNNGPEPEPVPPAIPENPYSVDDFRYRDGYMTCTAGETKLGVDVSSHQGEIDWQQVAGAGMEFAFIRIGYRGYTRGGIQADKRAERNITAAQEAGIPVGVYFYSQAISVEEALEEALYCIEFLEDYHIQLPVVYDWEYVSESARTGQMDRKTLTQCALAFCRAVKGAGYEPMIYFNPSLVQTLLDLTQLQDYPWWLAKYSDEMDFPYQVDAWQYTENGNVPGITGDVDIDLMFIYG